MNNREQAEILKNFLFEQIESIEGLELKVSTNGLQNFKILKYRGHSFHLDLSNKINYIFSKISIKTTIDSVPYVKHREDRKYFIRYLNNDEELSFNVKSYKDALDKLVVMKEELIKLSIENKVMEKEKKVLRVY